MKIKESEINKMVENIVNKIIPLKENNDFTAIRRIQHAAAESVMNFEDVIIKQLKLIHPDKMSPEVQEAYIKIMEEMKSKVVRAILDALSKLESFPREKDVTK